MEKFHIIKNLGEGTFGSAVLAKNLKTGEQVAIKVMKKRFDTWDECI